MERLDVGQADQSEYASGNELIDDQQFWLRQFQLLKILRIVDLH